MTNDAALCLPLTVVKTTAKPNVALSFQMWPIMFSISNQHKMLRIGKMATRSDTTYMMRNTDK